MSLECLHDLFDISPNVVVNEAVFSIRVKNHLALDYEKLNGTECTITAKEVVSKGAKSTSVPILIRIRDVNDNIPQFSRPSYQVKRSYRRIRHAERFSKRFVGPLSRCK